ncbi:MAG: S9 family peptidase, partial [Sinobacteraceae bacterium]|nr:S9 family peptidase [Nevskiaceae bacterium]
MQSRALSALLALGTGTALAVMPLSYPSATRGDHTDAYHDVQVADPYRWLEDIDSPATRSWVAAEQHLSRDYLDGLPRRAEIGARLKDIWNFERWSAPERHGRYWFYTHNDGLQNQSVVWVTDNPARRGHVLLDPNSLSADGTVALRTTALSDDGRLFAYALSDAG